MQVILLQDVKGHGKKGQLVNVSDGYARNYLLPRKLAQEANATNINIMKQHDAAEAARKQKELDNALAAAEKLKESVITVRAKGGVERLFGSVTNREIAEALKEQYSVDIDKHRIVLNEPIKTYGAHDVRIKLHADVPSAVRVVVERVE